MKTIFKDYLFNKHYLVNEGDRSDDNAFETLFALANKFNIRIISGEKLIQNSMIRYAANRLGEDVPEPFYRGFPQTVRELSADQLLFDQLLHYVQTYGFGDFSKAGHSLFEDNFDRIAFKESADIKEFKVITSKEAVMILGDMVTDLLSSTRPLSDEQFMLVKEYVDDFSYEIKDIASKNTAIKLLVDTRNTVYADFLHMSDVIKVVDQINYSEYENNDINKLNLKNQDRKFITKIMNRLFGAGRCDIRNCYEKKKTWNGLIHHIHYKPVSDEAKHFVYAMRSPGNESVFSEFERQMTDKSIEKAVDTLKKGKGASAVLRNLNYIISRCETKKDLDYVFDSIDTKNVIVLIQLLIQYAHYRSCSERTFKFTKHNKLKIHTETSDEMTSRRSHISDEQISMICDRLKMNLKDVLKDRLGKVYIDPDMVNYALPIQESTAQGGFGTLTRGSRIHIDDCKKIRAFTYWEKVDDIDLSVFGIDNDGNKTEFSWRTMAGKQSDAITYSGDQTSGFNGGSEYFDIDILKVKKMYPDMRYMIFCDNVYSRKSFEKCFCKAGYMTRDILDSGNVFEPKTVKTSFVINCNSTFAYLFGIDLEKNDLIWLNTARESNASVAGTTQMDFLLDYFDITDTINVFTFFEMMAKETVKDISKADVIVTDKTIECESDAQILREYDVEKMMAFMNM